MRTQKCSRCGEDKAFSEFHKDKSRKKGVQRYCKPCKSVSDRYGSAKNPVHKYYVYCLPKEMYVGMTRSPEKRMREHRNNGKNTDKRIILVSTKSKKLAHVVETLLHILGFDGFRY